MNISPLLIFLLLSLPILTLCVTCNPNDKKTLLQIKKSFNNPYHLASWNPKEDCCTWYALSCDHKSGRVKELNIFSGNISGQIPAAVGDLPYLDTLFFHKLTNLTGQIPASITKLTRLRSLTISRTNVSGPIPSFLSRINSLTYLDLSFNDFSGEIPPSLSELTNLEAIHLDRNKLTGNIPDSFGKFSGRIPGLYLSHNQLSGSIPKSLGGVNFPVIDVSRNKLQGDISFLFGTHKVIEHADFSRNLFEFSLTNVKFPKTLVWLDLNHNKISGNLPTGLTGLELHFLNVSYNNLCGKIPTGGKLQSFEVTDYFRNKCLCGAPLSACK